MSIPVKESNCSPFFTFSSFITKKVREEMFSPDPDADEISKNI